MPGISGLADKGPGQEMVLSEEMVEKIESLLNDLSNRGSPELQVSIETAEFFLKYFEGETFEEIGSMLSEFSGEGSHHEALK